MTVPVSVGVDIAIVCTFALVALLALRHREQPGVIPFVALTVILAVMAVVATLGREGIIPEFESQFGLFVPYVFATIAWLVLAFEYTGRGPVMTARRVVGLVGFVIAVIAVTMLAFVVPPVIEPIWIVFINLFQLSLIAAAGYGAFLVARSAISYGDLPLSGSLVLTTAGGGLVAITVVLTLLPTIPFETGFAAVRLLLGGVAVLLLLTQVRYRVFETGPSAGHLAREIVLDEMDASVAITDRERQVLDCNRTAERTFELSQPDALGERVEDAVGIDPASTDDQPITAETSDGRRQFEVSRSTLTSRRGAPIGRAYVLRDVTERRTHEQRLDVLNRVLRHNLRNDLDAIRGFAELLERNEEGVDPDALAERIHATATDLQDLGQALARAEALLSRETLEDVPVDIVGLLDRIAADLEPSDPDASIAMSTTKRPFEVRTDPQLLETVLEETVENAVEHNDADDPRVDLEIRRDSEDVVIDVRDNGPGIPQRELAVLLEGEETPLRHGTGLGLWLVYWGVTRLGGDLEFYENEPRGSVVSVRIPAGATDLSGGS